MEEYIDYSNPELESQINTILGDNYGAFKPLIIDTLLRRSFQFELSTEQSLAEARRFKNNVASITYGDYPSTDNASGMACPHTQTIRINMKVNNYSNVQTYEKMADFLNTIQHEIAHMLVAHYKDSKPPREGEEVQEYDLNHPAGIFCMGTIETGEHGEDLLYGSGTEESKTQTATGLINDITRPEKVNHAYCDLTSLFLVEAPALGVTISDLVYNSKSKEALEKLVLTRFNNDPSNLISIEPLLKGIDMKMRSLHEISYSSDPRIKSMSREEKNNIATQAVTGLINNCLELASLQVERDNRPINFDYVNELFARYDNIIQSEDRVFAGLADYDKYPDRNAYRNDTIINKISFFNKIFGAYVVNILKDRTTSPQELEMLTSFAKRGEIYELEDFLKGKFGLDLEEVRGGSFIEYLGLERSKDCNYQREVNRKDYHDGKKWPKEKTTELMKTFLERTFADLAKGDDYMITEQDVGSIMLKYIGLPEKYDINLGEDKYIALAQKMGIQAQTVLQSYNAISYSQSNLVYACNNLHYSRDNNEGKKYVPKEIGRSVGAFYANIGQFIEKYLSGLSPNISLEQFKSIKTGLEAFISDYKTAIEKVENLEQFTEQDKANSQYISICFLAQGRVNKIEKVIQGAEILEFLNKRYGYRPDSSVMKLATNGLLFDRGDDFYKSTGLDFREIQKDLIDGKLNEDTATKKNIFQRFSDAFRSFFNRQPMLNPAKGKDGISPELSARYGPRLEQKNFMKRLQSYERQPQTQTKEPEISTDRELPSQSYKEPER